MRSRWLCGRSGIPVKRHVGGVVQASTPSPDAWRVIPSPESSLEFCVY